ncbi:hypothetical protein MUN82_10325 [Hymenobacter aerilatus]|uniref:Uncharacterized protein n=1 Tax=Hymenobacter aerilatus TaxID=2932251 RepID=A0A8T9T3C4_9BACT|nr:hypothetical protein [Hymenobacter aerilatus]UOR07473.1 hypothetical protein MUN82_10325 [Hymenobacter aerilatus]
MFGSEDYKIKKGCHYHTTAFIPKITFDSSIYYEVRFDESCLYKQSDIDPIVWNKLIGLSTTYNHHFNSCRIGWRTSEDGKAIEVLPYVYQGGKRLINDLETPLIIKPNVPVLICINDAEFSYEVTINGVEFEYSKQPDYPLFNWLLGFYFGGESTAPYTMGATIKRLTKKEYDEKTIEKAVSFA